MFGQTNIRPIKNRFRDRQKREIIYISLLCYHQDDSCVKVGSDESHFNLSLIVRDN